MSERVSVTMSTERLPDELRAMLRHPPAPGKTFRVTIEAVDGEGLDDGMAGSDADRPATLVADIRRSLDDPRPSVPAEDVFARAASAVAGRARAHRG